MQDIWIFGDSFSTPFEKTPWAVEYIKWKGYTPKIFGDLIPKEDGGSIHHLGVDGCGNDTIFENVYKHAPLIKKGDVVIIGWSLVERFRLINSEGKFLTCNPNYINKPTVSRFNHISLSTLEEIIINRTNWGYYLELYDKIEFLNWLFSDMKLIQWTPFNYTDAKIYGFDTIDTIATETDNLIYNTHYSEYGHQFIASKFIELLNNDMLRLECNSLYKKDKKYRSIV
jgi:hypothetical protein